MTDALPGEPSDGERKPRFYSESQWLRAPRSGFCQLDVELGQKVKPGQIIGTIHNPADAAHFDVSTDVGGLVIGQLMTSLVNRGDALVHVATKRYERM
jgi:hypothetical protein